MSYFLVTYQPPRNVIQHFPFGRYPEYTNPIIIQQKADTEIC